MSGLLKRSYPGGDISVQSAVGRNGIRFEPDYVVKYQRSTIVVELKLYRSTTVPESWIKGAARQLFAMALELDAKDALLFIFARVSAAQRRAAEVGPVRVVDASDMYIMAGDDASIEYKLDELGAFVGLRDARTSEVAAGRGATDLPMSAKFVRPQMGADLCRQLRSIGVGREHATAYEQAVYEALKYIFLTELSHWEYQDVADDFLRRDIVARIIGNHEFWTSAVHDFRTRIVVFDCKNYKDPISQVQVYTTEKYLHKRALRQMAIIIMRSPPSDSAITAMSGALRESGRLITWLTDDDLCAMLEARDASDDPHVIITERVTKELMKIAR